MEPRAPASSAHPRALRTALAVSLLLGLVPATARADVGSVRRPKGYLSLGPTFELDWDARMRWGGEVTLMQYTGKSGLGFAAGFSPGRIYVEFQPAWVLGKETRHVVLGLNPGALVDVTKNVPCYGLQLTLWGTYVRGGEAKGGGRPSWAWPLFPFLRLQAVEWQGFAYTAGLMLKLPIPLS